MAPAESPVCAFVFSGRSDSVIGGLKPFTCLSAYDYANKISIVNLLWVVVIEYIYLMQ